MFLDVSCISIIQCISHEHGRVFINFVPYGWQQGEVLSPKARRFQGGGSSCGGGTVDGIIEEGPVEFLGWTLMGS